MSSPLYAAVKVSPLRLVTVERPVKSPLSFFLHLFKPKTNDEELSNFIGKLHKEPGDRGDPGGEQLMLYRSNRQQTWSLITER